MRKLPLHGISKILRFVSVVCEIVSIKVKVIDLSLFVKMSKVELGDWQLVAICELPVVVRPSGLACIAVAQGLRSGEGKCGRRHMVANMEVLRDTGSLGVAIAHALEAHHLLHS